MVMLHIYSAAYRPAFQNNTRGKFQTERYQNYNCFAMTCKQFIQFVFGRKPWNSTNHVFIQDQNRFFFTTWHNLKMYVTPTCVHTEAGLSFIREMTDLKSFELTASPDKNE